MQGKKKEKKELEKKEDRK
ncbi:MAG: hypothetical protein OHM56_01235 [Spiroplasma phoeniceum]|nr:MAG: hypothetical protein OHM57_00655 [Spiroplasma phoeniceum]UZQ33583.1 MAG: hypothetical protein OHM56_01235 [Spiroplasma phoeniceum]